MSKKLSPSSGFVRETQKDLYSLYNAGAEVSDFIQKIVPEGTSRTELYTMSVTQYDFKPEQRKYPFDFYFYADYLHNVEVQFNDEKLPRQAKKKSEQNRNKAIADVIFENILSVAVCFDTSKLISCV